MPKNANALTRERILAALMQADSLTHAAEIAGISRKTLYTHLNTDGEILLEYRNLRRAQLRETSDKLTDAAVRAVDAMISILDDENAAARDKIQSAGKILESFEVFRDFERGLNEKLLDELDMGKSMALDFNLKQRPSPL